MSKQNKNMNKDKNEVSKMDNMLPQGNIFSNEMIEFAKNLISGGYLPKSIKTPESALTIVKQGQELGFDAMTSLNNIHVIEGKITLSVHAISALLKRGDIEYNLLEDFKPIKDAEGKTKDFVTSIQFMRVWNGEVLKDTISFKWSEAVKQELTAKSNWMKMPALMMRARCLAIGARFVAPHLLMGMYETSEIADVKNVEVQMTEEGEVIIN